MCISLQSGATALERLPCLKYNVLKRENRLTLALNTAKKIDYMKKHLKLKLSRIQFPTKNSVGAHVYPPLLQTGARRLERLLYLKY